MHLDILVGIPGSGKSRYATTVLLPERGQDNTVLINTDEIRKELCGNEEDQSKNGRVFETAFRRLRAALKDEKNVIFDATNMNRRSRRGILNQIPKHLQVATQAHVVLASPEQAEANQEKRSRKVPTEVIHKFLKMFEIPEQREGLTEPTRFVNAYPRLNLQPIIQQLSTVRQVGEHHTENALQHTKWVMNGCVENDLPAYLSAVARYHDIGKVYCRTEDAKGDAHFYGHENVSTWLYLCSAVQDTRLHDLQLRMALLIAHHNDHNKGADILPQLEEAYGKRFAEDLTRFMEQDRAGSLTRQQLKEMSLLDVLNTLDDADEILSRPPFSLKISKEDGYVLYKYNQLFTDMSYRLSRQARGPIVKQTEDGTYRYVCRPFDKFFNHGEPYADQINWRSAVVTEKIDGSLCKTWYDNGAWHVSTNGMINAFDRQVEGTELTWGDLFERAAGCSVEKLMEGQDPAYTYLFELTTPETRIVVSYPDGICYLARRETATGKEDIKKPEFQNGTVGTLTVFPLRSMHDTVKAVKCFSKDQEGVVVRDGQGNRLKVKSPAYLEAAHQRFQTVTEKHIVVFFQHDTLDDLLAYNPLQADKIDQVTGLIKTLANKYDESWEEVKAYASLPRNEFAAYATKTAYPSYVFHKLKEPEITAEEYLKSQISTAAMVRQLQQVKEETA